MQPVLAGRAAGRARQHLPRRPARDHKFLIARRVEAGEPAGVRGGQRLGDLLVVLLRGQVGHAGRLAGGPGARVAHREQGDPRGAFGEDHAQLQAVAGGGALGHRLEQHRRRTARFATAPGRAVGGHAAARLRVRAQHAGLLQQPPADREGQRQHRLTRPHGDVHPVAVQPAGGRRAVLAVRRAAAHHGDQVGPGRDQPCHGRHRRLSHLAQFGRRVVAGRAEGGRDQQRRMRAHRPGDQHAVSSRYRSAWATDVMRRAGRPRACPATPPGRCRSRPRPPARPGLPGAPATRPRHGSAAPRAARRPR